MSKIFEDKYLHFDLMLLGLSKVKVIGLVYHPSESFLELAWSIEVIKRSTLVVLKGNSEDIALQWGLKVLNNIGNFFIYFVHNIECQIFV